MSIAISYMNLPKNRWYIFANRSEVAVFRCHKSEPLKFVFRMKNNHVDNTPRNFEADRQQDVEKFSSDIAARMARSWNLQHFDELVLAAEPRLLGRLRAKLPLTVIHSIVEEYSKDITHLSSEEAQKRINSWRQREFA